jgi:hypothetical protein
MERMHNAFVWVRAYLVIEIFYVQTLTMTLDAANAVIGRSVESRACIQNVYVLQHVQSNKGGEIGIE